MTKPHAGSRFGPTGKTVGGILAAGLGIPGAWGWVYLLAVSVQGPGGVSDIAAPFFIMGLLLWIIFWGAALGLIAVFFGLRSRTMLVVLTLTGLMIAAAIITPIIAGAL